MATKKEKFNAVVSALGTILELGTEVNVWRTIVSNGMSPAELIAAIEAKGCQVTQWAKDVMSKPEFAAGITKGITYRLVVIRGDEFEDSQRTNANIWAKAKSLGYRKLPAFLAAQLRAENPGQHRMSTSDVDETKLFKS